MKRNFFQAAVVSILLYGCTTWMLTKRLEKKLDGNYTRMLRAILNKSWRQHPTRHKVYGHLPPITKTIQVKQTRHAGHCWRSKDELISDVLLWTPAYGQAKAGRPARTYIQQLCEDTGCSPEDLPKAMNDWEKWRERVRDIRASGTTWWWWCRERDETVNHIISECSKLAQKEHKSRQDWVGKGIQWELCLKIEIWPNYRMVYVQDRIRPRAWDALNSLRFEIQTDHQIPARRPDLVLINKKTKGQI